MENNDTGVAESVFIGGMFVPYGSQYADILEHYGRLAGMSDAEIASEAANVRAEIGQVSKAVKNRRLGRRMVRARLRRLLAQGRHA